MVAFTYSLPSGIPGAVNRVGAGATVEAQIIMPTQPPTFYGQAVVMEPLTGQVRPPNATDVAPVPIYGLYVRPYPTHATQDPLGVDTPPTQGEANVLKRGYMTVRLMSGVAVKGAPVFVGLVGDPTTPVGGISGGPAVATLAPLGPVATTYFTGPADATGMTEVAFNL